MLVVRPPAHLDLEAEQIENSIRPGIGKATDRTGRVAQDALGWALAVAYAVTAILAALALAAGMAALAVFAEIVRCVLVVHDVRATRTKCTRTAVLALLAVAAQRVLGWLTTVDAVFATAVHLALIAARTHFVGSIVAF